MPVLINSSTGLAENLPDSDSDLALQAGSHELPLNDPSGTPITTSLSEAHNLISQGYSQPSPEQLQGLLSHAKYSSTGEQIKTALEGAGEAGTFGLSTGLERLAGVKPEDIQGRREANPGSHIAGQIAGLAASSLIPGLGEENILRAAGEGAAGALGLGAEGAGFVNQLGSAAVKGAVESAMIQGGDEVSKMFASDPDQSAQSALVDIGLGGLLGAGTGAAFGAVSPLWKMSNESKVGKLLSAIKDKANGLEQGSLPTAVDAMAEGSGLEMAPEIKAAISNDPQAKQLFQELREGATKAGDKAREAEKSLFDNAQKALVTTLGKQPEELAAIAGRSQYDIGTGLKESLSKEIKAITDPISERFDRYKSEFKDSDVGTLRHKSIEEKIGNLIQEERLHVFPDMPQAKLTQDILQGVKNIKTMEDINKVQTLIRQNTQDPTMWHIGKKLVNVFRDAEDDMTMELLGPKGSEVIKNHLASRGAYREAMTLIDNLNDRLHVGKYAGPSSFVTALKEMSPEDVLRRLSGSKDADLLKILSSKFPESAQVVKENHLSNLLGLAHTRAAKDQMISTSALFSNLEKNWSPELREFALPAGASEKISNIQKILEAVPGRIGPSGTPRTLDALWSKMPGGIMGMISLMTGHNPIAGYVLGQLGRFVGREVPDAVKLATLRFLGSGQPISSEAFKTAVELAVSTIKGEHLMNAAVKGIFKPASQVLPLSLIPDEKKTKRLDEKVKNFQVNPEGLFDAGGRTPYYLPDHGRSLGTVAARATEYLNQLRPRTDRPGVLDPPRVPSEIEKNKYHRALQIAEQPLMVLQHVKNGTLTSEDVTTFRTVYPELYNRLSQKMMEQITNQTSKNERIPYSTRISLSLLMGQPLDATLTPESIRASQPPPAASQQAPAQASGGAQHTKHSLASLGKINTMYQTPNQGREAYKADHKA